MDVIGNEISTVAFDGRVYTLPLGKRSAADCVPLMIWRRTGTLGGVNESPLMKKAVPFCTHARRSVR